MTETRGVLGSRAWYREFWVWFVIALPLSAVIAGFATLYLAITHPDVEVGDTGHQAGLVIHAPPPARRP